MKRDIEIKGRSILFALVLTMFLASCQWTTIEPVVPEIPDEPVSFSSVIQPVFTASCAVCHSSEGGLKGGLDLSEGNAYNSINSSTYINLTSPSESLIYTYPSPSGSHFGKYSITDAAYVLKWIEEGAEDN